MEGEEQMEDGEAGWGRSAAHSYRTREWINPTTVLTWKPAFKGKAKEQSNANTL